MPYNTIIVKGRGLRKEALAGGAITPGHLVARNSSLSYVAQTGTGRVPLCFAVENELAGKEISVAYANGQTCFVEHVTSGAEVYGLVAASAAAIVKGDLLESNGAGGFRKATDLTAAAGTPVASGAIADVTGSPTQATINNGFATVAAQIQFPNAIAIALESVDNSAGGTPARILVEVI